MPSAKQSKDWSRRVLAGIKSFFAGIKAKIVTYMKARPYRSLRLGKLRVKPTANPLPTILRHTVSVLKVMRQEKKNLLLLTLLYSSITYFVIGGLAQSDFTDLKETALQVISGDFGAAGTAAVLFLGTMTDAVTIGGTEFQQLLGGLIVLIFWLATVWLVRMSLAGNKVRVRDALYNCCAPLVPSFVVMLVVAVQLVPALLGIFVFGISISEGYLQGGVEAMMYGLAALVLCVLSLYWISASLVGLVMVSLPQTYPWHALSGASRLVIGQRWKLMKHVVALGVILVLMWVVVLFPTLLLDGWLRWDWLPLVPVVTQLLSAITLIFGTVYVYKLYRSLL